jgi:nitrate/nitrite transport system ATP-binding protein
MPSARCWWCLELTFVFQNQVTILLGHTGCGKTSLLQAIAGLVKPTRGYARLQDMPMDDSPENLKHYVGYSPQQHILYDVLSVEESIRLCCMVNNSQLNESIAN